MRPFLAIAFALVPGCALLPPSQSGGQITSPLVQASWEAGAPAMDSAESLDEALSACTGPLSFGVQAGDALAVAQWCDCYRERHETDRHAYKRICAPGGPAEQEAPAAQSRAPPETACTAPEWPDLRRDLDDALERLRSARRELAAERAETGALRERADALRRIGAGCRLVVGKNDFHQLDTTTWACSAEAVEALELAVTP